jgi:hypothetical protein
VRVDLVGALVERGGAGRDGQRVPAQGARLVHRPGRGEPAHDVGAAAERRCRQAAAHHLAEGEQVGVDALEAVPAAAGDPEAGHHLVADEQRAVVLAQLGDPGVEAGQRRDDAHVGRGGLGDDAGDLVALLLERRLHRREVVVGQHDRVGGGGAGDARGVGQAEGDDAAAALASSASTWPW